MFALVYVLFVHTDPARSIDDAALLERNAAVEISPVAVEFVDLVPVVLAVAILGGLAFRRRDLRLAIAIAALIVASVVIAMLVARVAPQVSTTPSHPSGHATLAMAVACSLVLAATPSWRRAILCIGVLLVVVVGVGLIALDWHRPSEVAAGYLLAFACACLAVAVLSRPAAEAARVDQARATRSLDPPPTAPAHRRLVSIVALAATAAFVIGLAVVNLIDALNRDLAGDWGAFAVGELILVALAFGLLASISSIAPQLHPRAHGHSTT